MKQVDETVECGTMVNMKAQTYALIIVSLSVALLGSGCSTSSSGEDDGANSTPVVSGTITVSQESDWETLKLGLFSGGEAGAYTALDDLFNGFDGLATEVRLAYNDNSAGSGTPVSVSPSATLDTVTGTGATTRNYSFTLSAPAPAEDQEYFFAAWLDADDDGTLDLVNASFSEYTTHATGEFNRLSWKNTLDSDDQPTTIMVHGFLRGFSEEQATFLQPIDGTWKYAGYDGDGYNEQNNLNSAANTSGFNFTMVPNNGW